MASFTFASFSLSLVTFAASGILATPKARVSRMGNCSPDCSGKRIPIGYPENLSDQFEALADSDLETFGSEGRTQCACHGFSITEVAHIFHPSHETGGARACVADPFVRAKGCEGRDAFTVPNGAQAAGRIYREKSGSERGRCQSVWHDHRCTHKAGLGQTRRF